MREASEEEKHVIAADAKQILALHGITLEQSPQGLHGPHYVMTDPQNTAARAGRALMEAAAVVLAPCTDANFEDWIAILRLRRDDRRNGMIGFPYEQ